MYRTNAQSRALEEAFRARGIRYRLLGGFSFYQRAEIRDIFAYVRLAMLADDDIALYAAYPPRIGKITVESPSRTLARERNSSLWGRTRGNDRIRVGPCPGPASAVSVS